MARTAFVAIAACVIGAANALKVATPAKGDVVVADRTYTVEWTGTSSDNTFEIDLYYCGSMCSDDSCGDWVTALCPYGEDGCHDNKGDYDVVMPEPMEGTSGSGYKVRVVDIDDEEDGDCSDEFYLMASDEVTTTVSEDYFLTVTSPESGDVAVAGDEYTVEFDYLNGAGSKVDRFAIDLYMEGGSGDCGTWITSICDKPSIGCKDSMGDYDVEIPEDTEPGMYSIRVGRFEDDELFGCSPVFEIVSDEDGDDDEEMSMSYRL